MHGMTHRRKQCGRPWHKTMWLSMASNIAFFSWFQFSSTLFFMGSDSRNESLKSSSSFVTPSMSPILYRYTYLCCLRLYLTAVSSSIITASWSEIPGTTSTFLIWSGRVVKHRSSTLSPRVGLCWTCVRMLSFAISRRSWLSFLPYWGLFFPFWWLSLYSS